MRWLRSIFPLLFVGLHMMSCGVVDDLDGTNHDSSDQSIVGGRVHSGHPSVGILNNGCTATLIGSRTVLTAAHCVSNGGRANFRVDNGTTYRSSRVVTHGSADIALVTLAEYVSGINPSVVNVEQPWVGQQIILVGFGQTSQNGGGFGTKRRATNTIADVTRDRFYFSGTGSTCYGDSGGPAFVVLDGLEVIAGVTSGGYAPCGTYAYDTRVDRFVDWMVRESKGDVTLPGDNNGTTCKGQCSPSCRCDVNEGQCTNDADCKSGLQCNQQAGTSLCANASDDAPNGSAEIPLVWIGNDGWPQSQYPLGRCDGDCDSDSECAGNLRCFKRDGIEAIPGCSGTGWPGADYCYSPYGDGTVPELIRVGNDGYPRSEFPLGRCEGDCDNDSECAGDLICFQRSGNEEVPGCSGSGRTGADYCYSPAR